MNDKQPPAAPGVEPDAISVRGILYTGAGLLVMLLASGSVIALLMHYYPIIYQRRQPPLTQVEQQREPPPRPHLEVNSPAEGEQALSAGRAKLQGYGWVPGEQGVAHIPIERAMQLLGERGWPAQNVGGAP
ncbi:hypothetical protein [Pseudomonas sp. RIT-PI-S]|uniref:hypothetical protein n=1 Tax=Pseudomonas sp. RIT-PI-S TaxID=3035295 RepID=UPI0021D8D8F8|nr:hypothetical protein [Pseudomonas sp. RIT-PI-S]